MNKHEDQFFQDVQSVFENHAPEVPEHIYAGIREKMKKKRVLFLGWSLNNWLLLIGLAGASAAVWSVSGDEGLAFKAESPELNNARLHLVEKAHRSIQDDEGAVSYAEHIDRSPAQTPDLSNVNQNTVRRNEVQNSAIIAQNNTAAMQAEQTGTNGSEATATDQTAAETASVDVTTNANANAESGLTESNASEMNAPDSNTTEKLSPLFTIKEIKWVEMEKEKEKKKK